MISFRLDEFELIPPFSKNEQWILGENTCKIN